MKEKLLAIIFGTALAAGVYSQSRLAPPNDFSAQAGRGQAEVIINAQISEKDVAVWMNGAIVAHIPPKTSEKIIAANGRYTLEVADTTERRGSWNIGKKRDLTVDLNSNRVTVGFTMRYGTIINLNIQETTALVYTQSESAARSAASGGSIIDAVNNAAAVLTTDLPDGATLAIISIASSDKDMADFVIEELAYLMVDTRKFKVVDRKSLDLIMSEQQFQMSGDVDDNSAVTIGKMLGASVVVTGSISGSGATRRLRTKALDVKTAEIVAMASEAF